MSLSEHRTWLNLLFYKKRLSHIFGRSSLIDNPDFFLAPNGDTDPKAELHATLAAFLGSDTKSWETDRHPLCRFPARLAFLKQQLAIPDGALTKADCPGRDAFMAGTHYEGVSLVFAHYFINSPQSMFGHTFLRLHGRPPAVGNTTMTSPLLDDVVNFSAQVPPEEVNGPFYAISGLLGGYRGRFALMPYYQKVQEYNNLESRDLWEYPLDLTKAQIHMLRDIIWELGDAYINYYFLTENCSYALLGMLEAMLPDDQLTSRFPLVAIPADTLRAVVTAPTRKGADQQLAQVDVDDVKARYRPSGLARYLWQAQRLQSEREQQGVGQLVASPDAKPQGSEAYRNCDLACQTRLLDTAIEYIDFNKRVGASAKAGDLGPLRGRLLVTRAQLPPLQARADVETVTAPVSQPPHLGHGTSKFSLGAVRHHRSDTAGYMHFRPALKDIGANPSGYSDQMEIRFLDTWVDLLPPESEPTVIGAREGEPEEGSPRLKLWRFSLVRILSLPDSSVLLTPLAWSFDLGFEPFATLKDGQRLRHRSHLSVSVGHSFRRHGERPLIRPFVLLGAKAYSEYQADHTGIAPFVTMGATMAGQLPARLTVIGSLGTNIDRMTDLEDQGEAWQQVEGILAMDLSRNLEARLYSEIYSQHSTWRFGLEYYF